MSALLFETFLANLKIGNAEDISSAYSEITIRLNKDYWGTDSNTTHRLQVGSFGRNTAIHGISDLDMIFELPTQKLTDFRARQGNGPSQLLQEVRGFLKDRYTRTEISGDSQVVAVEFKTFDVELVPAFLQEDGSYIYGDANDGGSWKRTNPRAEIAAMTVLNGETNANLKRACRMLRSWKNAHGIQMSGWLIDTLMYNFFAGRKGYRSGDLDEFPDMVVSIFSWLGGLEHQAYSLAPGSGKQVPHDGKFQAKAKKAAERCDLARKATSQKEKARYYRTVFGNPFPAYVAQKSVVAESYVEPIGEHAPNEQYIEDMFPVDIRHSLSIDCDVGKQNEAMRLMRLLNGGRLKHDLPLKFFIESTTVTTPYDLFWKVRNVGAEAVRRRDLRGEVVADKGHRQLIEHTRFNGDHYVEAYIVKNGVCIARARTDVPIS